MKLFSHAISRTILYAVIVPLLIVSAFYVYMAYDTDKRQARESIRINALAVAVEMQRALFIHMQRSQNLSRTAYQKNALLSDESRESVQAAVLKAIKKVPTLMGAVVVDTQGRRVQGLGNVNNVAAIQMSVDSIKDKLKGTTLYRAMVLSLPKIDNPRSIESKHYFVTAVAVGDTQTDALNGSTTQVGTMLLYHDLEGLLFSARDGLDAESTYDLNYQLFMGEQLVAGQVLGPNRLHWDDDIVVRRNVFTAQGVQVPLILKNSASYQHIYQTVVQNLILAFALIAVAIVIAWLLIQWLITRLDEPVNQLFDMSQRFTKGDYQARDEVFEYAEFDDIANGLKVMAETINAQVSSLNAETQKAQASERLKSQFLANMSHEIRTPMNAIMGFVQLLQADDLSEKQRFQLDKMNSSCRVLMTLINDILDLSKIEADGLQLVPEAVDLVSLLEDTLDTFRPASDEKSLTLKFVIHPDMPRMVVCDPIRIRQVINNLVSNAIKFTTTGGVQVNLTIAEAEQSQYNVRITVLDTGIGIPAESLPLLFQPFVQAEGHSTRRYSGTGLGLTISKQLIELMQGTLQVNSADGAGSEFIIQLTLPIATCELQGDTETTQMETALGEYENKRILIVEDNEINQLVLGNMIEAMGIDYDIAIHGEEALSISESTDYDLILMDLQMPVMDGVTAASKLKQRDGFSTPIIAVTANVMPTDIKRAKEAGMDDYLAKPIDMKHLKQTIDRWLML